MKVYCLFEGRHDLPENEGAICSSFNFTTNSVEKTEKWNEAISHLMNGKKIGLYVTGLTPALTAFLSEAVRAQDTWTGYYYGAVTLFHYNSATQEYWEQIF